MSSSSPSHVLTFRVGGQICALPAHEAQEVVPLAATVHVPGQPSFLGGFLNLRGKAIPVISLSRALNTTGDPFDLGAHIVIVSLGGIPYGLIVERVETVAQLTGEESRTAIPPHLSFNECALVQIAIGGHEVVLLSCSRVLLAMEQACVADLVANAQARLNALPSFRHEP